MVIYHYFNFEFLEFLFFNYQDKILIYINLFDLNMIYHLPPHQILKPNHYKKCILITQCFYYLHPTTSPYTLFIHLFKVFRFY